MQYMPIHVQEGPVSVPHYIEPESADVVHNNSTSTSPTGSGSAENFMSYNGQFPVQHCLSGGSDTGCDCGHCLGSGYCYDYGYDHAYQQTVSVMIPRDKIGAVIGIKGQVINKIRQLSGATRIKILKERPHSKARQVLITGCVQGIQNAIQMMGVNMYNQFGPYDSSFNIEVMSRLF